MEKPRCPKCKNVLYWRYSVGGWVCKNWKCSNYWKMGKGPVFPRDFKVGDKIQ